MPCPRAPAVVLTLVALVAHAAPVRAAVHAVRETFVRQYMAGRT